MDRVDYDTPIRFDMGSLDSKRMLVTEVLDSSPRPSTNSPGINCIDFGNTGFRIKFGFSKYNFDFTPENAVAPLSDKKAKYASILGSSLLELYKLLNNPEKMSELGIKDSEVNSISNITNSRMTEKICKLFSRSDTPYLAVADEKMVKINLKGFRDLKESDPLIEYLKQVSDRAKGTTVSYSKNIEEP